MNYTEGLLKEAAKFEAQAKTLRAAADLISKSVLTERKPTRRQPHKRVEPQALVDVLKDKKEMRVSAIIEALGVAKPTIYSWIKKTGLFSNHDGVVTLKDSGPRIESAN